MTNCRLSQLRSWTRCHYAVVLAPLLSITLFKPALAEGLNLLSNEYKPLVNTKAGRIELCGIHFASAAMTLDQRLLGIQGSINMSYAEGRIPGLMIKASVIEGRGGKLLRRKIHFVSFRVGQKDTRAMRSYSGEDGNSLVLATDVTQTGDFFVTFPDLFRQGAWVSISLDPTRADFTYRLPPMGAQDVDTVKQFDDCNLVGMEKVKQELEKAQSME